jgi:putative oxidoreductase
MVRARDGFVAIEDKLHSALVRDSITALRLAVGAVFLGFGVLKFFPDVSPAQDLAIKTIDLLTFGFLPWQAGIVVIATLECFIGICLLANRWMRLAVWLLALQLVGILAPIVLLTGRLFSGPHHAPTLEGQYVLKDIILVAAGMVIAAGTFRGGRMVRDEPQPGQPPSIPTPEASRRLEIVLSPISGSQTVEAACEEHAISPATYYEWRDAVMRGATRALDEPSTSPTRGRRASRAA